MPLCMLSLGLKNHEVAWVVISLVSVEVVNDLTILKRPAKNLLCNNAVRVASKGFFIRRSFPRAKAYCA